MNDKPRRSIYDVAISFINEPAIEEPEIEPLTARERADRRWGMEKERSLTNGPNR